MNNTPKNPVAFHALDRDAEIEISNRNLPHWFQTDVAIFITFRTADSIPKSVLIQHYQTIREWLAIRKLPLELAESILGNKNASYHEHLRQLTPVELKEFRKLSAQLFQHSLDDCHGECLLRDLQLAKLVADSIRKFDGERYDLDSLVIMPNHVHTIAQFRSGFDLSEVSQGWMRFSARRINRQLGRKGAFWQPECFDHLIRSDKQFEYLRRYIYENPRKANLPAGQFFYWSRDAG
jgi:REP element-mobilizing transposase RayT